VPYLPQKAALKVVLENRFWNPLLKDKRTSAFKELAKQVIRCKIYFLIKQFLTQSILQVEQELGLLFLNETIDPKLNIQVQYSPVFSLGSLEMA